MPGSYAHITFANIASEKRRLKKIIGFPKEAIDAANLHSAFLELGSVSPDYPYLDITSTYSKEWADAMHYTHTCKVISDGAKLVRDQPKGIKKRKCLAWLMGYSSHVVADMCIHPVLNLQGWSYDENPSGHRRCEMHQDVYIFRKHIGTGMPQTSDHLKSTILTCSAKDDPKNLDPDVEGVWETLLKTNHTSLYLANLPKPDKWHNKCNKILQKLLPTTSRFVGFARHVCDGLGFAYPTPDEIDMAKYIESLQVPSQKDRESFMSYDEIFNIVISKVQQIWLEVTCYALGLRDNIFFQNEEWNLDTGCTKLANEDKIVFWEVI
jgi:hypothetical protein